MICNDGAGRTNIRGNIKHTASDDREHPSTGVQKCVNTYASVVATAGGAAADHELGESECSARI